MLCVCTKRLFSANVRCQLSIIIITGNYKEIIVKQQIPFPFLRFPKMYKPLHSRNKRKKDKSNHVSAYVHIGSFQRRVVLSKIT